MTPGRVSLSNTLEQTLQTPSGRTFLIQVSWPLQWANKTEDTVRECPVLYIVDGNALFLTATEASWRRATGPHYSGGGIVVAVGYVLQGRVYDRCRSYDLTPPTPGVEDDDDDPNRNNFGGADDFLSFIIGSVKPLVARMFPRVTFTRSALYGHSYGGLFALHALFTQPEAFDCFIASSPSAWWRNEWILREAEHYGSSPGPASDKKPSLMLYYGSLEQKPRRWHDESLEDFEKRQRSCAERRMVDNSVRLKQCLLDSGKLLGVVLHEYMGEDHGSVMACSLSRSLTTFFEEWPL